MAIWIKISMIFFLIVFIVLRVSISVSRLKTSIKELTQELSLIKIELEEAEVRKSEEAADI